MSNKEIILRLLKENFELKDEIEELKIMSTARYDKKIIEKYEMLQKAIVKNFNIDIDVENIEDAIIKLRLKKNDTYQASLVGKGDLPCEKI